MHADIIVGGVAIDPRDVYGSQTELLKQTATNFNLAAELYVGAGAIDPRTIRALTATDIVTGLITKWGGATLTSRDISLDIAPASALADIADVTAAASATQVTASNLPCRAVIVRALAANTSVVRVGGSTVTASRGAELSKGDAVVLDIDNVNKVYVFGNATDKVSIAYVT